MTGFRGWARLAPTPFLAVAAPWRAGVAVIEPSCLLAHVYYPSFCPSHPRGRVFRGVTSSASPAEHRLVSFLPPRPGKKALKQ
jgi:hypothetical protein